MQSLKERNIIMKYIRSIMAILLVLATVLGVASCAIRETVSLRQNQNSPSDQSGNHPTEHSVMNHKESLVFSFANGSVDSSETEPRPETGLDSEPDSEPETETEIEVETDTECGSDTESASEAETETVSTTQNEFASSTDRPASADRVFTHNEQVFAFAIECVASDLRAAGFDVFEGYVSVNDTIIQGLIFTDYNVVVEETADGMTVCQAGFIQIEDAAHPASVRLTDAMLSEGLIAVDGVFEDELYLIDHVADVESWSGIVKDTYFAYEQTASSVITVQIAENRRSAYRRDISLYNYDKSSYVFKSDLTYKGNSAIGVYVDEQARYDNALAAVDAIIAAQNAASYRSEQTFTVVFSAELVDEWMLNNQQGLLNDFSLEELAEVPLEDNQFIVMTADGPQIYTIPDTSEQAKMRVAKGIMGVLGGALIILSVVVTVASLGTAAPVVVGVAVAAGSVATLYATSNIIEGIQDISLGLKGDVTTHAVNPILDGLKAVMDDDTATKLYHGIGITATTVVSLVIPTNAAMNMAAANHANVGMAVVRVIGVELAKDTIIAASATGAAALASSITTKLTGSEFWGTVAGYGAALTVGAFAAWGVNKIDTRFNINGLHSKPLADAGASTFKTADTEYDGTQAPREGDWGSYGDLQKAVKNYKKQLKQLIQEASPDSDDARRLQALLDEANSWEIHHVPGNSYMKQYGISRKDGMAMIIPDEYHKSTFTYGKYSDISPNVDGTNNAFYKGLTPDEALRIDMSNMRAILKENNVFTGYRDGLSAFEQAIRAKYPNLFSAMP